MRGRNPREWSRLTIKRKDDKHRFSECPYYDKCLTEAADKRWDSFTCYYCCLNPFGKEAFRSIKKKYAQM